MVLSPKVTETTESLRFLTLLLNYHTKARTMHTYIFTLLSAISSPSFPCDPRTAYMASFASPVLNLAHLDRISKCTLNFLTPGQTKDTLAMVLSVLKRTWDESWEWQQRIIADGGEGSRKKRKTDTEVLSSAKAGDPDASAVAFALSARISSMVLSSLPLQSLPESTRLDILRTLADTQTSLIHLALRRAFEVIEKNLRNPRRDIWSCQIKAAALLKLEYALISVRRLRLTAKRGENISVRLLDVASNDGTLPELTLEIVRISPQTRSFCSALTSPNLISSAVCSAVPPMIMQTRRSFVMS
jgi:hypothetical protein